MLYLYFIFRSFRKTNGRRVSTETVGMETKRTTKCITKNEKVAKKTRARKKTECFKYVFCIRYT